MQLYGQLEPQSGLLLSPTTQLPQPPKKRSSSSSAATINDYAKKMGDTNHHPHTSSSFSSSRLALRNAGPGEIVEVQGGHIVRSTGRKDRHSKVCTAKGPRDRRVRLSAHTAIQFYDVQDRLGYDRPSKAVDWLIKKAKPAIDELAELPAWKPRSATAAKSTPDGDDDDDDIEEDEDGGRVQPTGAAEAVGMGDGGGSGAGGIYVGGGGGQEQHQQQQQICSNADSSGLLPPWLHSDAIADTIKSFFPMGGATHSEVSAAAAAATSSSPPPSLQFPSYPPPDLVSRSRSHSQDLRLSLQSFQDPILMQSQHEHHHYYAAAAAAAASAHQPFSHGAAASHIGGFDHPSAGWTENQPAEFGRFQRLVSGWNTGGSDGSSGGGFMFNSPPPPTTSTSPLLQPFFGQIFSQREPLQSSNNNNNPLFRAWISDPSSISNANTISINPHSMAGIGFASGGLSGFHIPARIQGDEEHDGCLSKPSTASSNSRH